MTTNPDPDKIAKMLTLSVQQLDDGTLSALRDARQLALKRQAARTSVLALNTGRETHSLIPDSIQHWVIAGLLVAMLIVGMNFWHNLQEQQTDELDVAILTDDLPIEVFVD
jgi:Protein of unknown function (DUF3619)